MTDKKKTKRGQGIAAVFGHQVDGMTVSQQNSKPVKQHDSKSVSRQAVLTVDKKVKATYYLDPGLIKKLKLLAIERETDLSALVAEAIKNLLEDAKKP